VVVGVLLAACGTASTVLSPDAGTDAQIADAQPFDVTPASTIGSCFVGGFIIAGQTSSQPGFSTVGGRAVLTSDAGVATLLDDYVDSGMTLELAQLSQNVASVTLASGQPNVEAECVACVCLPTFYPTAMIADAGALVSSNGVAFVSVTGPTLAATPCGDAAVQATTWAVCQEAGASPTPQPLDASFVTGTHACQAMLGTVWKNFTGVAYAANDSISIAQAGATLTVQYDASWIGSGSVELSVVTPNVAIGTVAQDVTLGCNYAGDGGAGGAMPVTAASLVVEGTTLVLSITGSMGPGTACESATHALVLACTP
jgi:hypothetical protein